MKNITLRRFYSISSILVLVFAVLIPILKSNEAKADQLGQTMVRLDRLTASTATGGTVCAKPTATGTEASVQVTFPTGFAVGSTASNWTTTTTNLPGGTTAWAGIGTATAVAGQVVTFPSTDLTVGTIYCFNFSGTSTLTTGTSGNSQTGTIITRTSAPATIDSGSYAVSVITSDQIAVTATVPPIFTFSLSGNTDTFSGNLDTSTVRSTAGKTTTIATNATNGWVTWVKSANAALNSAVASATIPTAGTVDNTPSDLASTTGYVLDADITTDSSNGTGTVTQASNYGAEYNGTNTTSGGALSTTFQPIAASNGTTDGDVLTLTERAKITAYQAAATDYTDTLTVVAAGRF